MRALRIFLLTFLFLLTIDARWHKSKPTPATWSEWGEWDEHCSATCGIGVRRRTRNCSYKGNKRKLRCKGNMGQMKNCDTKTTCPVDGGWSSWVSWDCSASCGGGMGQKKRSCTNPRPMFGGNKCKGEAEDEGKCNEQKCPDQVYTLSPGTAQNLKDATERVHNSIEKPEESNVDLSCNPRVIEKIYKEYPTSVLFWTKDGKVLRVQLERMEVNLQQLTIQNLTLGDNGVYLCSMRYAPEVMKPVAVISLAAIPKAPIKVPAEESVSLSCGGAQLGTIYKDLTRSWFFESKVYKDFGNVSLLRNKEFEITNVTSNMTGTWRCKIRDPKRGWAWTMNIVRIETLPPLPWYLKLPRRKKLLAMIGISLCIVLVFVCMCIGYQVSKARAGYLADFEVWRQIAEYETPSADELESESDEEVSLISNDY